MRFLMILMLAVLALIPAQARAQSIGKPMVMPVASPSGPSTWLFGQAYGNTPGAYNFGDAWYRAGQGLHFGIDVSMPCGTPLVAVADGVIAFVDDLGFGAGPHNLIVRHDQLGVTTLYGHLQGRAPVSPGQQVVQGEQIGVSGDPDSTCFSRPHLHFEVRSLDYQTTFNPIDWIDVDWHTLALVGAYSGNLFQGDMENPGRWMSLDDQPDVRFYGPRLNAYRSVFPRTGADNAPNSAGPLKDLPPLSPAGQWSARTIGSAQCCWQNWWHPTDAGGLYSIDGLSGQPAQVMRWDLAAPSLNQTVEPAPPEHRSPDWTWRGRVEGQDAVLFDSEGREFRFNTGGALPAFSADNSRLLWVSTRPTVPGEQRAPAVVRVAGVLGGGTFDLFSAPGANAQWLDDRRVLVTVPGDDRVTTMIVIDAQTGEQYELGRWSWVRGTNVGPGGQYVVFYATNQPDPNASGVYAIRTEPGAPAQRLPFFGSWRWRDSDELYAIPLEPGAAAHALHHVDLNTRVMTPLSTAPFKIMNGDWAVNADGTRVAFRDISTRELTLLEVGG